MANDFDVHINPGLSFADTSVDVSGKPTPQVATLADVEPFGLYGHDFKGQIKNWLWDHGFTNAYGGAAEDTGGVWFDETGEGLLCTGPNGRVDWHGKISPARITKRALNARVLSIQLQTVLADKDIVDATGATNPQPGSLTLSQSVEDAVESHWDRSQTVGVSVEVGVEVGPVSASTSLSYESSWGEGGSNSRTSGVGSDAEQDFEVEPGKIGMMMGLLKRGVIVAAVDFEIVPIDGDVKVVWYWKHGYGRDGSPLLVRDADGHAHNASWGYVPFAEVCKRGGAPLVATQVFTTQNYAENVFKFMHLPDTGAETVDRAIRGETTLEEVYHHTSNQFELDAVNQAKKLPRRLDV